VKTTSQAAAIRLFLTVLVVSCAAAGAPASGAAPSTRPAAGNVKTVAILAFHCRAGKEDKDLATAIALVAGSVIQQSGRAAVVDRAQVEKVIDEKTMARAEWTDKVELAKAGRMIGADYMVTGHYDLVDGKLVIRAELLASRKLDLDGPYGESAATGRTDEPRVGARRRQTDRRRLHRAGRRIALRTKGPPGRPCPRRRHGGGHCDDV